MIDHVILRNLLKNEEYTRKILPFLKDEYFKVDTDRIIFSEIRDFVVKYNELPSYDALCTEVDTIKGLTEDQAKQCTFTLKTIHEDLIDTNLKWLVDTTEKFCQEKALHVALVKSVGILNGTNKELAKGAIPSLLQEALGVSFDSHVGHDFIEDADARFEYYHEKALKLPFDLKYFNEITKGGVSTKTLNIILAGINVGKSLAMCHLAAGYLNQGKNVLYITLEMAEEEIAKRIDVNLFNLSFDELDLLSKDGHKKKIDQIRQKTNGKLIIKEYPTAGASVLHFKALLNELWLKKKFKPDVVFIDYLNLCVSSRVKRSGTNLYDYVKSIAEELRGLAIEFKLPIWSATQMNRTGFSSSDPGMTDTSESFGLPAVADFMVALVITDELEQLNQYLVKQLKNRYNSKKKNKKFVIGVDLDKQKLYDVEQSAQKDISDSGQVPTKAEPKTDKFKKLKMS